MPARPMFIELLCRSFRSYVVMPVNKYGAKAAFFVGPRIFSLVVQLVTLPIVLHGLPIRDYGVFSLAAIAANFVAIFTFPQITFGSKVGLSRGQDGTFIYAILKRFGLSIPLMLISLLLLWGAWDLFEQKTLLVFSVTLGGALIGNIVHQSLASLWISKERFLAASTHELIRSIMANGAGAVAAAATGDVIVFVVARAVTDSVLGLIVLLRVVVMQKLWNAYRLGMTDVGLVAYGRNMIWANGAVIARTEGLQLLTAAFFGVEALSIFRTAYSSIYTRLQNQLSVITDLVYKKNANESFIQPLQVRVRQYVVLGLLGSGTAAVGIIASYLYINYTLPVAYHEAFIYVSVLLCSLPFDVVYSYVNQLLMVRFDYRKIILLQVIHAILQLTLLIFLASSFGVMGACISVLASLLIALLIALLMERVGAYSRS